jgi:hypothetical protein
MDSLDSPQPGFGGSHHLPPYSILYASPPHLHLNGTFSRDSQSGIPKLSRFGLPGLWAFITFRFNFRLGQDLKQTCSSPRKLFNGVSHSTYTHRNQVDSQLLVVGSQNLTLGPSFNHNLCYRCPNGSCKAILDIYTLRHFQWYKEHFNARCFGPYNWVLGSFEGLLSPIFGSVSGDLTFPSKWGCNTFGVNMSHGQTQTHKTHHGPNLGETTTFPLIVYFMVGHETNI